MSLPSNLVITNPSLKDLLDRFKQDLLINLNCHAIGSIVVFDASTQTATVSINYQKTVYTLDPLTQQYQSKQVSYPILMEAPVIVIGGGLGVLTFPILPGDECIIFFNDRDIDNWYQGSTTSPVATPRLHSFSDAIILVGLRSKPKVLTNYSSDKVELTHAKGNTGVSMSPTDIKMYNPVGTIKIATSGKGTIDCPMVDIGTGASHGVGLGDNIENRLAALENALATLTTTFGALHTHPVISLGSPTGPPIPIASPFVAVPLPAASVTAKVST